MTAGLGSVYRTHGSYAPPVGGPLEIVQLSQDSNLGISQIHNLNGTVANSTLLAVWLNNAGGGGRNFSIGPGDTSGCTWTQQVYWSTSSSNPHIEVHVGTGCVGGNIAVEMNRSGNASQASSYVIECSPGIDFSGVESQFANPSAELTTFCAPVGGRTENTPALSICFARTNDATAFDLPVLGAGWGNTAVVLARARDWIQWRDDTYTSNRGEFTHGITDDVTRGIIMTLR